MTRRMKFYIISSTIYQPIIIPNVHGNLLRGVIFELLLIITHLKEIVIQTVPSNVTCNVSTYVKEFVFGCYFSECNQ